MVDPTTPNVGLFAPTRGSDPGTWDVPLNANASSLDGFFGGVQIISATNAPITLTSPAGLVVTPSPGPTQSQNAVLRVTGTLTTGVQITLPLPGVMAVGNFTTGAFVLSFRALGSGEVIAIEQGSTRHIYNDGTNVRFINLPDVGTYLDICDATVPAWITACTIPPFLNCDGSTFNAATYPYLNTKLGGNTLPDLRGVARYTLNQGTGRLTTAGSGLDGTTRFATKFTQAYTLVASNAPSGVTSSGANTIIVSSSIATLINPSLVSVTTGGFALGISTSTQTVSGFTSSGSNNITVTSTGTAQPFGVIGTGTVSGITLIRAA